MATVKFVNVNKIYDNFVQAVFDFNLDVKDKEFVVLVGPSGCGKSTTLRMLAGLEDITSGEIIIDDVVVNDVHPKNRDIAMVFQNYALYPHMTVYDNMAFALKMRHLPKEEIDKRVHEAAEVLALEEYLKRKPKALSGGQRQRVALGRAIVRTPKVFLMDEPLSNLDAKLRVQMRSEIIKIHKRVNATTIYVTHDQTEAMTMADRIVIMKGGYIQQIGTPKEVYNFPNNMFVGGFIGSPAMNFINCHYDNGKVNVKGDEPIELHLEKEQLQLLKDYSTKKVEELKEVIAKTEDKINELKEELQVSDLKELEVNPETKKNALEEKGRKLSKEEKNKIEHLFKINSIKENYAREVEEFQKSIFDFELGVRPEDIIISKEKGNNDIEVEVDLSELLGHELIVYSYICGQRIIIKVPSGEEYESGTKFYLNFKHEKVHFFDLDTTNRIVL